MTWSTDIIYLWFCWCFSSFIKSLRRAAVFISGSYALSCKLFFLNILNLHSTETELRMEVPHCGLHVLRLPTLSSTLRLLRIPCLNVFLKFYCFYNNHKQKQIRRLHTTTTYRLYSGTQHSSISKHNNNLFPKVKCWKNKNTKLITISKYQQRIVHSVFIIPLYSYFHNYILVWRTWYTQLILNSRVAIEVTLDLFK